MAIVQKIKDPKHSEKYIEADFNKRWKAAGGLSIKMCDPNNSGMPDRLFLNTDATFFIEFKSKGQKPRPLQIHMIEELRKRGHDVYVSDSVETNSEILDKYVKGK
ncbi:nuclease [Elizabethkingia phage TCUEAP1]|nr:nuclease [Elizabethkingia phage TCUEAP1]